MFFNELRTAKAVKEVLKEPTHIVFLVLGPQSRDALETAFREELQKIVNKNPSAFRFVIKEEEAMEELTFQSKAFRNEPSVPCFVVRTADGVWGVFSGERRSAEVLRFIARPRTVWNGYTTRT